MVVKNVLGLICVVGCVLQAQAQQENIVNKYGNGGITAEGTVATCDVTGAVDYFPWKIPSGAMAPKAKFTVEYKKYYKIVKTTGASPKTYLLTQKGCKAPTDVTADVKVEIPLKSVAVASSTWFGFFSYIGESMSIKGVNGFYSADPCLNKRAADASVLDMSYPVSYNRTSSVYDGLKADFTTGLEASFVDDWTAGKNPIYVGAEKESTYLVAAEWIHFISAFYNKEQDTALFASRSKNRWACSSASVPKASVVPKVAWINYMPNYGKTSPAGWQVNNCLETDASFRHCDVIKAAGGSPVTGFTATASPNMYDKKNGQILGVSDADIAMFVQSADVIVIANHYCSAFDKTGDVESCNKYWNDAVEKLKDSSAYKNKQIYDIGMTQDPLGGSALLEAAVQPEVILQDIITAIANKEAPKAGDHKRVYLRKMLGEGVGNQVTCASKPAALGCKPTKDDLAKKCDAVAAIPSETARATECSAGAALRALPLLAAVLAGFATLAAF